MKRAKILLISMLLCLLAAVPAWAQRVYDQADLFSAQEEETLEGAIQTLTGRMNMDFVLLTTNYKEGKSQAAYADDFYDYNGFGFGSERDGMLFMIDMQDRDCYISTSGLMIDYLTDDRIAYILQEDDGLWDLLSEGRYASASARVMDEVWEFYQEGIPQAPRKTLSLWKILASLAAGFFAGTGRVKSIESEYKMENARKIAATSAFAYTAASRFAFGDTADDLLTKHVTQRIIQTPRVTGGGGGSSHSGSSTHTSSSGHTHGGGGSGGRHF